VSVRIDASDFVHASQVLKNVDPMLRKEMMKGISVAANYLLRELRQSVKGLDSQGSFSGGHAARGAKSLKSHKGTSGSVLLASGLAAKAASGAGLRDTIARNTRITKKDSGLPGQVGVKISVQGMPSDQRRLPRKMDQGQWRHPVYGHAKVWADQTVSPSGWWSNPVAKSGPATRQAVELVIHEAMQKLAASLTTAA